MEDQEEPERLKDFLLLNGLAPLAGAQVKSLQIHVILVMEKVEEEKNRKLEVNIPAGVEEGSRIRLSGEGAVGPNGSSPGDLYLFISMVPHEIFEREATEIFCNVPISIVNASLGGSVDVPTVSGGKVKVKIPAGSQNGDQFKLTGKGMPTLRSTSFGDMIISLNVEVPRNLSDNQKRLLKEFDEESSQKNNPESSGFFSKVKDFWDDLT